jgi:hypothetical protein
LVLSDPTEWRIRREDLLENRGAETCLEPASVGQPTSERESAIIVGILATSLDYHSPKLPGMGEVDWGRFFSVLTDSGYQGPVCIEAEDRAFEDSLESRKQSLKVARDMLKSFFTQ